MTRIAVVIHGEKPCGPMGNEDFIRYFFGSRRFFMKEIPSVVYSFLIFCVGYRTTYWALPNTKQPFPDGAWFVLLMGGAHPTGLE
jgi:hypothetical protein